MSVLTDDELKKYREFYERGKLGPCGSDDAALRDLLDTIDSMRAALFSIPSQSGERNGPLPIDAEYFAMEILFHIDEMYPKMWEGVPNTARTSVRNTIINKLVVLNASVQSSLESLKLEVRKRAFEEAAEHEPSDYNGSEWDWECDCGVHGHWSGDDNWKTHVLARASAPAVPEKVKR